MLSINEVIKANINKYLYGYTFHYAKVVKSFGIIFFINYPLFYIIWLNTFRAGHECLILRVISSIICIPLIFFNRWCENFKKLALSYWYLSLIFCLPFFFSYMTFINNFSTVWVLNLLLALFLLFLLLGFLNLIICSIFGIMLAYVWYIILNDGPLLFHSGSISLLNALITFVVGLLIAGFLLSRKEDVARKRLNTIMLSSSSAAHEMRTPLQTVQVSANRLEEDIAKLSVSYEEYQSVIANLGKVFGMEALSEPVRSLQVALEAQGVDFNLNDIKRLEQKKFGLRSLRCMADQPERIKFEVRTALLFIEMLLTNARGVQAESLELKTLSMEQCIQQALERYPFRSRQMSLIHVEPSAYFDFNGNEDAMIHIFFNLIKNALFFIHQEGRGEIRIWGEQNEKYNKLYFKDTARGVMPNELKKLFNHFYTNRKGGTGIGLAYCKHMMHNMQGEMSCNSVFGEYIEFCMQFPKV